MSLGWNNNAPVTDKAGNASPLYQDFFTKLDQALVLVGTVTPGHLIIGDGGNSGSDGGAVPVGGITQLTGDVTAGPGSGSQVATIANNAVTFAKMQDIATQTAIGRNTAGTGDPESVTISQMLDWTP